MPLGWHLNFLDSAAPLLAEVAVFGGGSNALGAVGTFGICLKIKFEEIANAKGSFAAPSYV
jgi:hypothetical protein